MSSLRLLRLAGLVAVIALSACASDDDPPDFPDPDLPARDTNPDGVPYPTDSIGRVDRAEGRRGDRIPNLTFQAYVNGDRSKGLQVVSLADFYDPQQKRYKVLDIQVAAVWCTICSSLIAATKDSKDMLAKEGVVFLQMIVNGAAVQKGPALEEVDGWVDNYKMTYTVGIDVRGRRLGNLGVFTVPWDILIDTRTMEILDSSAGAPLDVVRYVRDALQWVSTHPPSY